MNFQNILVVCIGNICRSPMAEALLKQSYPDRNVFSAGLEALVGHTADPMAIECMNEVGVDINTHVARLLDRDMLIEADIVFAMSNEQVRAIEERWSFSKGKVFKLCHWSRNSIPDPYRKGKPEFLLAKSLIEKGVSDWRPYLN
jgi:protein-tyrosine phosphatase